MKFFLIALVSGGYKDIDGYISNKQNKIISLTPKCQQIYLSAFAPDSYCNNNVDSRKVEPCPSSAFPALGTLLSFKNC